MRRLQVAGRSFYICRYFCNNLPKDSNKVEPIVIAHGGAGAIFDDTVPKKVDGVKMAVKLGYEALMKGNAVDAVEQALQFLDDAEHFNSGRGAVLNADGEVEMEAVIMTGDLKSGAVCCVKNIAHPISLARLVMEKTSYSILSSTGALEFAKKHGMEILRPGVLITEKQQKMLKHWREYDGGEVGSAGVVALDKEGNLAAGSSSGGINRSMPGRSGDCALIGCGVYADNLIAAVAATGPGEVLIKTCLAYAISNHVKHGLPPSEAIQKGLFIMDMRLHTTGGAILISKNGQVGFSFNTKRMPWAYNDGTKLHYGIEKGEHNTEKLKI